MEKKLKILLISYYYGETASGVISKRAADQLANRGHEVIVITQSSPKVSVECISSIRIETVTDPWNQGGFISRVIQRVKRTNKIYLYNWQWVNKAKRQASRIVKSFNPDIIYCRTSPEDACYVGYYLQQKYGIPTFQHFSDPVPPPLEYVPNSHKRNKLISKIGEVIRKATMVSYGNDAMLKYVESIVGFDIEKKAFISPDMASSGIMQYAPICSGKPIVLVYFGSLYGGRNPHPLFKAVANMISQGYQIELHVYSNISKDVLGIYPFVKSMAYNPNTFEALSEANILIDLDGDDEIPVFISSKLKDYLLINRPVISITPDNSPSRRLLEGMKTIKVVNNVDVQVKNAIESFIDYPLDNKQYSERAMLINYFNPETVGKNLLEEIERCVN